MGKGVEKREGKVKSTRRDHVITVWLKRRTNGQGHGCSVDEGHLPDASHVFHFTHVTGTADEGRELANDGEMAKWVGEKPEPCFHAPLIGS